MKRVGGLWTQLTDWQNLAEAARRASLGKRSRPDVAAFLMDLEPNLAALRRELLSGGYTPGAYRTFLIREPKPRQISAAPFRDRVVHHALTQILEPVFEPRFSPASYACRVGKGSHRALKTVSQAARTAPYVLKCDIRKYFASVDHAILLQQLERAVKCRPTLDLASRIIAGSNAQEEVNWYFPGDLLLTPYERRRGLPLGNQTSQFFANVYLNALDQLVTREVRPAAYARYVDDFLLLDTDKGRRQDARIQVEAHLDSVRLRLHEKKSRVYRTADGVTFLGWRVFPDRVRLVRGNVVRFRRRLRNLLAGLRSGELTRDNAVQSVQAWIGHARHGGTWRLREQIFERNPIVIPPLSMQCAQSQSQSTHHPVGPPATPANPHL